MRRSRRRRSTSSRPCRLGGVPRQVGRDRGRRCRERGGFPGCSSAAGSAFLEDGGYPATWIDDEEYELVETGGAAGGVEGPTDAEAPLDWADHEERNNAVSSVHTQFATTAEDDVDDVRGAEDDSAEVEVRGPSDCHRRAETGWRFRRPPAWPPNEPPRTRRSRWRPRPRRGASATATTSPLPLPLPPTTQTTPTTGTTGTRSRRGDGPTLGPDGASERRNAPSRAAGRALRRGGHLRRCRRACGAGASDTQPPVAVTSPVSSGPSCFASNRRSATCSRHRLRRRRGSRASAGSRRRSGSPPSSSPTSLAAAVPERRGRDHGADERAPAFASANAQVVQDINFLKSIDGLPPVQLGSFIDHYFSRITQLQATLDRLQQDLQPIAP